MDVEHIIQNFKMHYLRDEVAPMRDILEYHDIRTWGIEDGGAISGFGWIEHEISFSGAYMPLTRHSVGIIGEEKILNSDLGYATEGVVAGVKYIERSDHSEKIYIAGEIPDTMLVERDAEGRITFCGMQECGERHGLGVEFILEGKSVVQRRGIWLRGALTHCWTEGKFIKL